MPLSADRCEHFSLGIGSFLLSADTCRMWAPVESCDLCVAVLGSAGDAMPTQVYGPDGLLVTRATCTTARRDASCLPALARDVPVVEWQAREIRAASQHLCAEARAARKLSRDAREAAATRAAELARRQRPLVLACHKREAWFRAHAASSGRASALAA